MPRRRASNETFTEGAYVPTALLLGLTLIGPRTAPADALELHRNRVFVPVTINGVAAEALLDSAAEMTFIDPSSRPN